MADRLLKRCKANSATAAVGRPAWPREHSQPRVHRIRSRTGRGATVAKSAYASLDYYSTSWAQRVNHPYILGLHGRRVTVARTRAITGGRGAGSPRFAGEGRRAANRKRRDSHGSPRAILTRAGRTARLPSQHGGRRRRRGRVALAARRSRPGGDFSGRRTWPPSSPPAVGVESETVALETVPAAALQLGESDTTRSAGAGLSPRPVRRRPRSRPPAGPGTRRYPAPGVESDAQLRRAWGRTVRLP